MSYKDIGHIQLETANICNWYVTLTVPSILTCFNTKCLSPTDMWSCCVMCTLFEHSKVNTKHILDNYSLQYSLYKYNLCIRNVLVQFVCIVLLCAQEMNCPDNKYFSKYAMRSAAADIPQPP